MGLAWFIPLADGATVLCLLVAGSMAGIDVIVRQERSALPYVGIGAILGPLWLVHLLSFTGVLQPVGIGRDSGLLVHVAQLAMPVLLIWVLLQPVGSLSNARWTVASMVAVGVAVVAVAIAMSIAIGPSFQSITLNEHFTTINTALLAVESLAAGAGLWLFAIGRRGDSRFGTAVTGASILLGFGMMVQFLSSAPYDAAWYAAAAFRPDPPLLLMAGLLSLYGPSLQAALHDSLTGLPNRTMFAECVKEALVAGERERQPRALLMLDLDGFKEVNDELGHEQGDLVLQEVAWRLRRVVRKADTVARIGGDEFAVLPAGATDISHAILIAEKILEAFEPAFELGEHTVDIGGSIGITVYPDHGDDAPTLARHADRAMYVAKRSRSGYSVYAA